jgi:hypothetical protein
MGDGYHGLSSAYWYDAAQFHELLLACGTQPVRALIAQLDGCSGGKAGEIVNGIGLERTACQDVSRAQAEQLLKAARKRSREVTSDRLGAVGRDAYPGCYYAVERGIVSIGADEKLRAEIPYVAEVWAVKMPTSGNHIALDICINRTPSTGYSHANYNDQEMSLYHGSGLRHGVAGAPTKGFFIIRINITTAFCPITSDGKAPDLNPFVNAILIAVATATRKAKRAAPDERKVSIKDVVYENMEQVVEDVGNNGEDVCFAKQVHYRMRPIVHEVTGQKLTLKNFNKILTDYENDNGEIENMYRDPRGSISHPHSGDVIPLGTKTVEHYERPFWEFNKILFIEKEGFSEALRKRGWDKRHDCMVMSSKGFSTRAAKDIVDKLAEHDEPVDVYLAHDADSSGTMIYQTFVEATKARGARKIKIVNLGLEPWEAIALDFDVEEFEKSETKDGEERRRPVAQYVLEREDTAPNGDDWDEWLQTNRIELNAMTTPELIEWLDRKMAEHGAVKLIPPSKAIANEFEDKLAAAVRTAVFERILREAKAEQQVARALRKIAENRYALCRPDSAAALRTKLLLVRRCERRSQKQQRLFATVTCWTD